MPVKTRTRAKEVLKSRAAFTIALIPTTGGFKREWRVPYRVLWYFAALCFLVAVIIALSVLSKSALDEDKRLSRETASAWLARWEILEKGKNRISANLDELQKIGEEYYKIIFQAPPDLGDLASADSAVQQRAKILPLMSVMQLVTAREDAYISMPIGIAVRSNQITSLYGRRIDPFGLETNFHTGIDFAGGVGAPIYATADGVVVSASDEGATGLGKNVRLEHKFGIITVYAHMDEIVVRKDQRVRRGDLLGYVGMTGRTTGPHLHYEVRVRSVEPDNYYELTYNPMPFIREKL